LLTNILPPTTAGIDPEQLSDDLAFASNRRVIVAVLAILLAAGFALRVNDLGAESLGEDELNKLRTVEEYRQNGLSGRNGEHPFLMKGMQTVSVSAAEKLNAAFSQPQISEEAALRFPVALFGTFTTLLIFLLVSELFGRSIGIVSAALWAVEPMAIGFDRIAKEDSLVLFFFLLTNLFWIRGQSAAERGEKNWLWHAWATAAGFAALMASKYYPHMLAVTAGYYNVFNNIPGKRWNLGKKRWLVFVFIMGATFLVLNPTILFPETWREMLRFSTEQRVAHDAYEFMGALYPNKMTAWLAGVPWTFYYIFIAVKTSLPTLLLFLIGLPFLLKRRMGDGRFFLFFWAFFWFLPFTFLGGKFTRYFTLVQPLIYISAAVGFLVFVRFLASKLSTNAMVSAFLQTILLAMWLVHPLLQSVWSAPHYRMYTNRFGAGSTAAGYYFPHDEFYDATTRDVVAEISSRAAQGATVACETPGLFEYYAQKAGRGDLLPVSLSDPSEVLRMKAGDFVVITKGRRYFSNTRYQEYLESVSPAAEVSIADVSAAKLYQLNETTVAGLHSLANSP
jgi:Dolichyl-phosphate-mannose-protein mannosyltransferase